MEAKVKQPIAEEIVGTLFFLSAFFPWFFGHYVWWVQPLLIVPKFAWLVVPLTLFVVRLVQRRRRRWSLVLLVSTWYLFVGMPFLGQTGPYTKDLRVMTWNIQFCTHGVKGVAEIIGSQSPDVVLLQEVDGNRGSRSGFGELVASLPDYEFRRDGDLAMGWKKAGIRLIKAERIETSETMPVPYIDRPFQKLEFTKAGREFQVVNVHWWPQGYGVSIDRGPLLDRLKRNLGTVHDKQAVLLNRHVGRARTPTIAAGDFNREHIFSGIKNWPNIGGDGFELAGRGYGFTISPPIPYRRIDRIYLKGFDAKRAWTPSTQASDHLPVVADVSYREPSQ